MTAQPENPPRTAVVTGGLGDIGMAVVLRLARDGLAVCALDRVESTQGWNKLAAAAEQHDVDPGLLSYRQADVTDRHAVQEAVSSLPRLDIMIANAGTVESAPILDITDAQWQSQLNTNLTGSFLTAQIAARRLRDDGTAGLLLFTGSWVGSIPWPEITAYTVTKAGLEMMVKQFARELAPLGIRANVVAPGIVRAGLAKKQLDTEPQYAARVARVVPMKQLQTTDQVAAAFSFLCSPGAEYLTGSVLLVDGGASLFAFD